MQFALLGDVQFELITYFNGLDARFASDYAEHALIEGKPRLQWIGDKLDEFSLSLKFHQAYCDPETEVAKLRSTMGTHSPLPFVLATGEYRGEFVISEISAVSEQTDRLGGLVAATCTLKLRECPDPKGERRASLVRTAAPAVMRSGMPVPPAAKTGNKDQARPNLPATSLKEAVVAVREVVGVLRTASAVITLGHQLSATNPLLAIERLARGVVLFEGMARASDRCYAALSPITGPVAEATSLMAMAGRLASEARGAATALADLSEANLVGRLDSLAGNLARMDGDLNGSARTLARLSARVAVRAVV